MTITAYATFGANLADLTITGVQVKLEQPPETINPGDMPLYWVQDVQGVEAPLTSGTHGGWPTMSAQIRVAVQAVGLGSVSDNYADTLTMMDNICTALRGATLFDPGGTNTANLGRSTLEWEISYNPQWLLGDTYYWLVTAIVTGKG